MWQSFPTEVKTKKEFDEVIGNFTIFLFQGVRFLVKMWKDDIYFGDCKPENFLVSFKGKKFIIGDFGIAF